MSLRSGIMLIWDNDAQREELAAALGKTGYPVHYFKTADEAIKQYPKLLVGAVYLKLIDPNTARVVSEIGTIGGNNYGIIDEQEVYVPDKGVQFFMLTEAEVNLELLTFARMAGARLLWNRKEFIEYCSGCLPETTECNAKGAKIYNEKWDYDNFTGGVDFSSTHK